jgi:hypothetical protein
MYRGEGAFLAEANGRNRRSCRRIVRRPARLRKVEPESDDEVPKAQGDTLLSVTRPRDLECAPMTLPSAGKGGQRRFVAATTRERKSRDRGLRASPRSVTMGPCRILTGRDT